MGRYTILLSILWSTLCSGTYTGYKKDGAARSDIKGKVKMIADTIYSGGIVNKVITEQYNIHGDITYRVEILPPQRGIHNWTYTYDGNNKLTHMEERYTTFSYHHIYDKDEQLIYKYTQLKDSTDTSSYNTYTYDKQGELISSFASYDSITYTTVREKKGRVVKTYKVDQGRSFLSSKVEYSRRRNLLASYIYDATEELPTDAFITQKYAYDKKGRVIESSFQTNQPGHRPFRGQGPNGSPPSVTTYSYSDIDAHGNYRRRTASFDGFSIVRMIEYYE